MTHLDVSVVIPTLNSAVTLPEQLEALERQDFAGAWELIIADNGSSDTTRAIAARWQARLPGLRVIDAPETRGASHARNRGAAMATGELLLFCDADDVATPDWMSSLVTAAADADAVGGQIDVVTLNSAEARYWRWADGLPTVGQGPFPFAFASNLLVRTSVFEELGGFDENLRRGGEDVDLSLRLREAGRRLRFTNTAVVRYRLRPGVKAAARQAYWYGWTEPYLYRKHRPVGRGRRSTKRAIKSWGWLIVHSWQLGNRRERGRWIWIAAKNLGQLTGSLRYRVVCF